jgi:hypothetical protein
VTRPLSHRVNFGTVCNMTDTDPLAVLVQRLEAQFHARRRSSVALTDPILAALEAYVRATDERIAGELSSLHALPHPPITANPAARAEELLRLVQALPELCVRTASAPKTIASPPLVPSISPDSPVPLPNLEQEPHPQLLLALTRGPLVIVGGTPHPTRLVSLSSNIRAQTEWIDTTHQGTHAIGNLERRIRERRIGALLLLEGLVQHRHSDPLISAARTVDLPHAYGGRGGRATLSSALNELNRILATRHGATSSS